jgi:hypothetical protein
MNYKVVLKTEMTELRGLANVYLHWIIYHKSVLARPLYIS